MQRKKIKVYFREYTAIRLYLGDKVEWVNLQVDAGYDYDFEFTFEDLNETYPRVLYEFPEGTTFHFKCSNEHVDIEKIIEQTGKVLDLPILSTDIQVPYSTTPQYVMDYVRPDGRKFPLCKGQFVIKK